MIRGDSSGDYEGRITKVENGSVEVNDTEKTLSVTFFNIGKTFKIDTAPSGNEMKLSGTLYLKDGGSSKKSDTSSSRGANSSPSNSNTSVNKSDDDKSSNSDDGEN